MCDLTKVNVKKLSVALLHDDSRQRTSFCWKYFGNLVLLEAMKKRIVNPDHVYCSVCLNSIKTESEDVTFGSVKIKSYNKTVSTGNLTRHLKDSHQIQDDHADIERKSRKVANKKNITGGSTSLPNSPSLDKWSLAIDIALWFCRSLLPFDSICDKGMVDFFKQYNIILTEDGLPSRYTVSCTALDDIHECMLTNVREKISHDAAQNLAMIFELWRDHYRGLKYITVYLHYVTADFELKTLTLNTEIIHQNITGEKTVEIIRRLKEQFGLNNKNITVVSNEGENVREAIYFANMDHHLCIGHGFNALITVDGINAIPEIKMLVNKCQNIVKALRCRLPELEADVGKQKEFFDSSDNVLRLLEDDRGPISDDASLAGHVDSSKTATPARWLTVLEMLKSLIQTYSIVQINRMLENIEHINHVQINQYEWDLMKELVTFLGRFREVVQIMISQKTCTLNLALLFRSEVIDVLNSVSENQNIHWLKQNMLANINKRFPVSRVVITAAILDYRFINLKEVDTYLDSINMTRASFLSSYIKEMVNSLDIPGTKAGDPGVYPNSNDTSLLHKLSIKHRVSKDVLDDPIDHECWRYVASVDSLEPKDGDLLTYWNSRKTTFPYISALARALLCMPATSAPTARVFSMTDLDISAKRSKLNPSNINKIIFIHDNFKECTKMFDKPFIKMEPC